MMTKRKDKLKALFAAEPSQEGAMPPARDMPVEAEVMPPPSPTAKRSASGAVKAMGLSLGQMANEIEDVRRLKQVDGEQILSLDPQLIDSAMIADRLSDGSDNDESFISLMESLRDNGQQVPVLVRPHPNEAKQTAGRYQAAYGHRRIRAARELGINVQAIIRDLSDEALVMAQGKENAERRDLSFVERAFFAKGLMDHGFDRATAQAVLSVHKTEMTRLLQVADRIPIRFARAIGPAPKAGRPRWLMLANLLARPANVDKAIDEIGKAAFKQADSDQRFQMLFARLSKPTRKNKPDLIKGTDGRVIAEMKGRSMTLSKEVPDGFTDYLADELPKLMTAYEKHRGEG